MHRERVNNWDGYDGPPIRMEAIKDALTFIDMLPLWMPAPEINPDPEGDIDFVWDFGRDRMLSVTFSGDNLITYASILGAPERTRCESLYFNDSIPQEITDIIQKIR